MVERKMRRQGDLPLERRLWAVRRPAVHLQLQIAMPSGVTRLIALRPEGTSAFQPVRALGPLVERASFSSVSERRRCRRERLLWWLESPHHHHHRERDSCWSI